MWQPIETAPKDRRLLLYRPGEYRDSQVTEGCWVDLADDWLATPAERKVPPHWKTRGRPFKEDQRRSHTDLRCPPTHWMPIPAPPSNLQKAQIAADAQPL